MAKPTLPDHEGRMPDHPRYGNPSDPAEEDARIRGAAKNLDDWAKRTGGQFSGGVTMSYGGKAFEVPIGNPEIAAKVSSRPLQPKPEVAALPEPAAPPPEPPRIPVQLPPQQSLLSWIINRIKGAFQ